MGMRGPLALDAFARITRVDADEIERYRKAGLLDPDGDELFDEFDLLRLRFLRVVAPGRSPEQLAAELQRIGKENPWADVLYGADVGRRAPEGLAERLGITDEQIRSLRVAVGLPESFFDESALSDLKQLLEAGIPWEAVIEGSRVLGDSLRRVADTEVRLFHAHVHERLVKSGMSEVDVAVIAGRTGEAALPVMERTVARLHRGHLLRASVEDALVHAEREDPASPPGTLEASILFVDIALFTSLAQAHGDEVAIGFIERFDDLVRSLAFEHGGSVVKQIGDEFMLSFSDPAEAARFALALEEAAEREPEFPGLRMGINHGPVLFRMGDYFGNTVNIAARVVAMAMAGEILVTEAVADAADAAGVPVERVGVRVARGVRDPVALARLTRHRAPLRRDPVCGMTVGGEAPGRLVHEGTELLFCSSGCMRRFLDDPAAYAGDSGRSARSTKAD